LEFKGPVSLIPSFFGGRLLCAQADLFSNEPASKNAGTIYFWKDWGHLKELERRLDHYFASFFHKINVGLPVGRKFPYKPSFEELRD
jgi:hypothetical protein